MGAPLLGLPGIDLHLGQKPKLGGRYTDISLIEASYSVGTLYIHVSLSFVIVIVQFISVIVLLLNLGSCYLCNNLSLSFYFIFLPRIASNRKEVIFGELLS